MSDTLSFADICVARAMLKSLGLPTELVLEILAYAEYLPVLEFTSGSQCAVVASAKRGSSSSARVCLPAEIMSINILRQIAGPKPNVTLKIKEIEFQFTSRDQGWTTENMRGTYNTSSWLEVSILRPGPSFLNMDKLPSLKLEYHSPEELHDKLRLEHHQLVHGRPVGAYVGSPFGEPPFAWYLQGNKVADRSSPDYRVVWAPDHSEGNEGAGNGEGFFDVLREGDCVLVWARAKYPGWRCEVDSMEMTVRYAFDESS